jgi:hypothetical protein
MLNAGPVMWLRTAARAHSGRSSPGATPATGTGASGLGTHGGPGVFVPGVDPLADVGFEFGDASVCRAAQGELVAGIFDLTFVTVSGSDRL